MDDSSGGTATHLRVALIGCSGLLGDIIGETLAAQPDLEVVGDFPAPSADDGLPVIAADLVVWNNADVFQVERWLSTMSNRYAPRVLATLGDGRDASLFELTPQRTALGQLSPATLIDTIHNSFTTSGG